MAPEALPPSMTVHGLLRRRTGAAMLVAGPALWLGAGAQPAVRRATPSQTEGPFYPVVFPPDADYDLLRNGAQAAGWPLVLPANRTRVLGVILSAAFSGLRLPVQ